MLAGHPFISYAGVKLDMTSNAIKIQNIHEMVSRIIPNVFHATKLKHSSYSLSSP